MRHWNNIMMRRISLGCLPVAILLLTACASIHESPDFTRHRYSQLAEPYDRKDVVYFDAIVDANYPDDDPGAEAQRLQWLSEWLEVRKMCPGGHEVVARRPFDMLEYNPGNYDVRYEVRCKVNTG